MIRLDEFKAMEMTFSIDFSGDHLILIDLGHGIDTPGKRSPLVEEWQFTRYVYLSLHHYLNAQKINHILINPEQKDISLRQRCLRANRLAKLFDHSILFSIHGNAFGTSITSFSNPSGIEVFTSPGQTMADQYATRFIDHAKENMTGRKFRLDLSDQDPDKEAKFYMLQQTQMPAILFELGFYTNYEEAQWMLSPKGIHQIAQSLTLTAQDFANDHL